MATAHLTLMAKHGQWLVKLSTGSYLGPYGYEKAVVMATALAEAAWEFGYDSSVDLDDGHGELRTIWNHPAQRHEAYI